MLKKAAVLAAFVVMLLPMDLHAAFRCGHKLVHVGDTTLEVLGKCGEPTLKEVVGTGTHGVFQGESGVTGEGRDGSLKRYSEVSLVIERWYYDCGVHRFLKILTFQGGILKQIRDGGYGSGKSDCLGAAYGEPAEKEPEPAPPEERFGRISVLGSPYGAQVHLNGIRVGDIPCTLEQIKAGPHVLTVKQEGYREWAKRLIVKADRTTYVRAYLENREDPASQAEETESESPSAAPTRIYKWVDEEGQVHILDRPPADEEAR